MLKKQKSRSKTRHTASTNRRIFSGMAVVAVMTLVVKLMAAAKELVIADYFGTGDMVDAFLFAYLLPAFAINVLSGSFSAAMMPTYIRTRENQGIQAANKLFSSLMLVGVLFLLVAAGILAVFAPTILSILGSGFNEQTMLLTQTLFYWLLPVLVFTGIGQLFATIINAGERFATVALAPALTPICMVIALITLTDEWGIFALAEGAVLGAALELLVLIIAAVRKNIPVLPRWHGMTEELRTVIGQYTPMIAGAFLMSGTGLVDQSMAAMLEPGSVATLNYANKVVAMILSIGSMALGTAVLPHFSRLVGHKDWVGLRHTFRTYAWLIVFISVPATVLLFLFSQPIIQLLFERGAFTSADTRLVSQVQAYYLLQLPFYMLGILGVRLISAMTKNDILMKIAAVSLIINIAGNYLFMQHFGVAGIALSTAMVYFISTIMILIFLNKSIVASAALVSKT